MRKVQPVKYYKGHQNYPSSPHTHIPTQPPTSRRAFLGEALDKLAGGVGALAGVGALLSSREGGAKTEKPKKYSLYLRLQKAYVFRPCGYLVGHITARTTDKHFVTFATAKSNKKGISDTVIAVLKKHSCRDLTDGKRLARLERRLGKALAAHYKKKTRRRTPRPEVTLKAYKKKRRPPPPGVPPMPNP